MKYLILNVSLLVVHALTYGYLYISEIRKYKFAFRLPSRKSSYAFIPGSDSDCVFSFRAIYGCLFYLLVLLLQTVGNRLISQHDDCYSKSELQNYIVNRIKRILTNVYHNYYQYLLGNFWLSLHIITRFGMFPLSRKFT